MITSDTTYEIFIEGKPSESVQASRFAILETELESVLVFVDDGDEVAVFRGTEMNVQRSGNKFYLWRCEYQAKA